MGDGWGPFHDSSREAAVKCKEQWERLHLVLLMDSSQKQQSRGDRKHTNRVKQRHDKETNVRGATEKQLSDGPANPCRLLEVSTEGLLWPNYMFCKQ
jgi:hypothetical protein